MGAPQNAMMASPMYLSMVPSEARRMSVIGVRKPLSSAVSSVGFIFSDIEVKPRMSEKRIVALRRSPCQKSRSGFASIVSAICLLT